MKMNELARPNREAARVGPTVVPAAGQPEGLGIAFMNSIGLESWGGGEKWMLSAGKGLRARGHRIVFIGRRGSLFLQRCRAEGFPCLGLKLGSDFGPGNILRLTQFFREQQIDVLIANFTKDVRLGGTAARLAGVRRVFARNGLPIVPDKKRYRWTYRWWVDGIITNTEAIKRQYLSYGWMPPDFVTVIANGIDVHQQVHYPGQLIRKEFGLPENRPLVGTFGRLVKQKQQHIFLEMAREVLKEFPETVFLVVGSGPLRHTLQQYAFDLGILDSVYFLGFQEKVMPLYSICDVVVLTSETEGQPNCIMEAMLAGKAVVAFDVGGVRELIPSPQIGLVVPANDIYRLTQAMIELLLDPEKRDQMGRGARQFALQHFSVEKMIDQLEQFLCQEVRLAKGGVHGA